MGREARPDVLGGVRRGWEGLPNVREALPKIWKRSGGPPNGRKVRRLSHKSKRSWEDLPKVWEWSGGPSEDSGSPTGGSKGVRRPSRWSRRVGRVWEVLPVVREGLRGLCGCPGGVERSWEALPGGLEEVGRHSLRSGRVGRPPAVREGFGRQSWRAGRDREVLQEVREGL